MRNFNTNIPLVLLIILVVYISLSLLFLSLVYEATEKTENNTIVSHIVGDEPIKFKKDNKLIITVKTSSIYYTTRLKYILQTWYRLAPDQIYFVSDTADADLPIDLGSHFLDTDCGITHQRAALSCKLTSELEVFYKAKADWSCHFDDDNYVNVPNLAAFLSDKNPNLPHYFGKVSVAKKINVHYRNESISFAFGTGGAGFCLSRWVVEKLFELAARNITVVQVSNELGLTDDVSLGFIISHFLDVSLTEVPTFHSHIETLHRYNINNIKNEISLSAIAKAKAPNTVNISPITIDDDSDKFRFRAIHCSLFPQLCDFTDEID